MRAFQVCGYSKRGKTTTATGLIQRLASDGLAVASIKDIHYDAFAMDREGTNTDLHARAGAEPVVARGLYETDFLFKRQMDFHEILSHVSAEWLVVEGWHDFPLPKIVCAKTLEDADAFLDRRTFALAGVLAETHDSYQGVPVFNPLDSASMAQLTALVKETVFPLLPYVDDDCCGRCGLTCAGLTEAIVQKERSRTDCQIEKGGVSLQVEGKEIPMVPFVKNILKNTVLGVVSELKGWQARKRVEVTIDPEG